MELPFRPMTQTSLLSANKTPFTFDALRIAAANMFAGLVADFRPIYKQLRSSNGTWGGATRTQRVDTATAACLHLETVEAAQGQMRNLRKGGLPEALARPLAATRKGPWQISTNGYLAKVLPAQ